MKEFLFFLRDIVGRNYKENEKLVSVDGKRDKKNNNKKKSKSNNVSKVSKTKVLDVGQSVTVE